MVKDGPIEESTWPMVWCSLAALLFARVLCLSRSREACLGYNEVKFRVGEDGELELCYGR